MAGKKGRSGRKTIREEVKAVMDAHRIFFDEHDQAKIEEKIQSGKFSLKDRLILTGMSGDTAILTKTLHKLCPTLLSTREQMVGLFKFPALKSLSVDESQV